MTKHTQGTPGKTRWLILGIIAVLAFGSVTLYAIQAVGRYQERTTGVSEAAVTEQLAGGDRLVFRNTAMGQGYGRVASVDLADPQGARELTELTCDRVDATAQLTACMRTVRGIPTTFETRIYAGTTEPKAEWPLAGIPSRTRVSEAGLVATTAFVTGHSYAADSFSTETTIKSADGKDHGNLEEFSIQVDGQPLTAVDRNVWGVTFVTETQFYATVASGGKTWLVQGDLERRELVSVMQNAECPSISPDHSRIAYKKRREHSGLAHWDIAVLDLKTREEVVIPLEQGFDDQLEWLDDQTLLFGMPQPDTPGDSNVYSIAATANATPQLFVEHAWSPSVVRSAG